MEAAQTFDSVAFTRPEFGTQLWAEIPNYDRLTFRPILVRPDPIKHPAMKKKVCAGPFQFIFVFLFFFVFIYLKCEPLRSSRKRPQTRTGIRGRQVLKDLRNKWNV